MILPLLVACAEPTPEPPRAPMAVPAPPSAPAAARVESGPRLEPGPDLVGLCDASAAVTVGDLLVVADDERNVLRVFDAGLNPAGTVALAQLAPAFAGKDEADLEGMATMADGTVWITGSHDAGKGDQRKPSRQRLVALKLRAEGGTVKAELAHGPTDALVERGQDTNELHGIVVNTVGRTSKDPLGLSIEGLASAPGGALLFGFRHPIHGGKALVQRLDDPIAFAKGGEPELTGPRWLPLGDRGIRSLEADGDGWLLIAGPGAGQEFALYRWSGFDDGRPPEQIPLSLGDLNPEALVRRSDGWWVLSDDGTREIGGQECKDLPDERRRARTARIHGI